MLLHVLHASDYVNLYHRFLSFGPAVREEGVEDHGVRIPVGDLYDAYAANGASYEWNGRKYPSLMEPEEVANVVLHFAPETNGEVAYRGFLEKERVVGLPLADLAEKNRAIAYDFLSVTKQPKRILTSPCWSGITNDGRAYSAYCQNVERLSPWRTLTGRQHLLSR